MKIRKIFGTDKVKEDEGTWIDMGDGAKIKVARMGNPKYTKEFQRLTKPYRQAIRRGTIQEELAEKLLIEALAKHILIGWVGITDDNDKEIAYSTENSIMLLTELKDFRDYVTEQATSIENFKQEVDEDSEKNSQNISAGT